MNSFKINAQSHIIDSYMECLSDGFIAMSIARNWEYKRTDDFNIEFSLLPGKTINSIDLIWFGYFSAVLNDKMLNLKIEKKQVMNDKILLLIEFEKNLMQKSIEDPNDVDNVFSVIKTAIEEERLICREINFSPPCTINIDSIIIK